MSMLLPANGNVLGFYNRQKLPEKTERWLVDVVSAVENSNDEALKILLADPIEPTIAWDDCIFLVDDDGGGPGSSPEYYNLAALAIAVGNNVALDLLIQKRPQTLREYPARVLGMGGDRANGETPGIALLDFAVHGGFLPATRLLIGAGFELKEPESLCNIAWRWPEELLDGLLDRCHLNIIQATEPWLKGLFAHAATWFRTVPDYAQEIERIQKRFEKWGVPVSKKMWEMQVDELARNDRKPHALAGSSDFHDTRLASERLAWMLNRHPERFKDEFDAARFFENCVRDYRFHHAHAVWGWMQENRPSWEKLFQSCFWFELSRFDDLRGAFGSQYEFGLHKNVFFKELLEKIACNPLHRPKQEHVRAWKDTLEGGVQAVDQILAVFLDKNPELAVTEWAEFTSPSLRSAREQLRLSAIAGEVRASLKTPDSDLLDEVGQAIVRKKPGSKRRV